MRPSAAPLLDPRAPARRRRARAWWRAAGGGLGAMALATGAAASVPPVRPADGLTLIEVARGLDRPVHLAAPARDARLFVVEQPGRIRILRGGHLLAAPFLDLGDRVRAGGERGLLGLAFHPRYAENGLFFVNYTGRDGATRVERYRVGDHPDRANPASARLILEVAQPYANHNGGHLLFGPDGMLYVALGDGGAAGDPHDHGQNPGTLLGALLRLDVDGGEPYRVPDDNPFRQRRGWRGEIWAFGLRNPWRIAFDRVGGRIYIADVGQDRREEINVAPTTAAGLNYGWRRFEGSRAYDRGAAARGLTMPAVEYGHDEGCSVVGGVVYRGRRLPELAGHYFYADYCRGWIRSFRVAGAAVRDHRQWRGLDPGRVTSFGEDAAGEVYVLAEDGRVWRLARAAR